MKTYQMTLEEDLVSEIDRVVKELGTTRSAFTRGALRMALDRIQEMEMERRHREGYLKHPVKKEEFGDWESEQIWGD